jgi:hypothetical protein
MKVKILLLSALLVAGCGSSSEQNLLSGQTPGETSISIEEATLNDVGRALEIVPIRHLNPLQGSALVRARSEAKVIPISALQSDYETLFGSLNDSLGVTLNTPQVVRDIEFVASQSDTGNFDLRKKPILNNPLGVTGVSFQAIEYDTTVPLPNGNQTFRVSGGVILLQGISKAQLKGVVVYFHGTTFDKSQVGSNYESNGETQLTAQIYASQGYAVIIPDYVGQGIDWANVHPYVLFPKVSAQTAVDMLTAVKPMLQSQYGLNANESVKLFSAGFSEGGGYSLWFNQYLSSTPAAQNPFYRLTHSVGMDGAYSTSEVTYNYLFGNVSKADGNPFHIQTQLITNTVKPILSADAFLSYATYQTGSNFTQTFLPDFFAMLASPGVPQSDCNVSGQQLTIAQAFALPNINIAQNILSSAFSKSANGFTYPSKSQMTLGTQNNVSSLVSPDLLGQAAQAQLLQVMRNADVDLSAVAPQGVSILTLERDSVVVSNNFDHLLNRFPSKIKKAIRVDENRLQVLSPFSSAVKRAVFVPTDHLHAVVYEHLYALNIFNSL